jgi:UDP-2-acetamido-3-amino-2,3-dideoxy-glucuronate N-acetyltransferase
MTAVAGPGVSDRFVHPTALVEEGVAIGRGTRIWDNAHLRRGAVVGEDCIVGGKSYLAGSARVGDRCKINAMVYICSGVTLGDGVFVAAHTTFTNDFYPRACVNDLSELRPSEVDEHTTFTTVQDGVSIGACTTIGSDLVLGRFCVVGMGAVVTRSVAPYTLVLGSPARPVALVCRCARPIVGLLDGSCPDGDYECPDCAVTYGVVDGLVVRDPLDPAGSIGPGIIGQSIIGQQAVEPGVAGPGGLAPGTVPLARPATDSGGDTAELAG